MAGIAGVVLLALSVLLFELLRVMSKLPDAPGWAKSAGTSSTAIILIMASFVTGLGLVARFAMDFEAAKFQATHGVGVLAVIVGTAILLALIYRRRRRSRAGLGAAGDQPIGRVASAVVTPTAGAANQASSDPDEPAPRAGGKGKDSRRAA